MSTDLSEFPTLVEEHITPSSETEQLFIETLAGILNLEDISKDSHFFTELGADSMSMARFCARIRKKGSLPTVSMKMVYAHPTVARLATAVTTKPPTDTEQLFIDTLGAIMNITQIPRDSHFFDELGADSMMMARFCARIRKKGDLPTVSMKMVYEHPTIAKLATAVTAVAAPPPPMLEESTPPEAKSVPTSQYILCGLLQILTAFGYFYLSAWILFQGYIWVSAGQSFIAIYLRALLIGGVIFLGFCTVPVLLKWLLIRRWKPQQFEVWSLSYFRFWFVKTVIRFNPMVRFVGTPLYTLYLRSLGAKIGKNVLILSPQVPVCTDLLTIGDNTVIRKDAQFNCYRAHSGTIQSGRVTIGSDVIVGEMTVLDIDTTLGDGAQLGHSSSLHAGQSIPAGEHRYGSPAKQRTAVNYGDVPTTHISLFKKIGYSMMLLVYPLLVSSIFYTALVTLIPIVAERPYFVALTDTFSTWLFYVEVLLVSAIVFFGLLLLQLLFVFTIPRLLNKMLKPNTAYPLYGLHYWAHLSIARITNDRFFVFLFGDSSYVVPYLRWLGYDLSDDVIQTGSNFGSAFKHDNPFLVSVGRGTIIADGLSIINADYSSSSFQLAQASIGAHNFLGNNVAYPSQGRTDENCLLGTKVMVPVEGDVRENMGLLGAPSFEIPRTVMRDKALSESITEEEQARRLSAKNRHNLVTMGIFLTVRWFYYFLWLLLAVTAVSLVPDAGPFVLAAAFLLLIVLSTLYRILTERASTLFRPLEPQECSIYDPYFWYHERFWKLGILPAHLRPLDGTPLKGMAWWLLGVRVGKRLFDDGANFVEKTMVTIGDDCTLNAGTLLQPHSQEDGGFKSDYITLGSHCTTGVGSFLHYGVTIGDGVQLAPDAFLMKGEEVPSYVYWGNNPAMEVKEEYFFETAVSNPTTQLAPASQKVA